MALSDPTYDPAAPLHNPYRGQGGDPAVMRDYHRGTVTLYVNAGFDNLGRWWWGAPIEIERVTDEL